MKPPVVFLNPRLFFSHLHYYHSAFSTIYKPSPKSIPLFYHYLHGVMCAPRKFTCCSLVTLQIQTQAFCFSKEKSTIGSNFLLSQSSFYTPSYFPRFFLKLSVLNSIKVLEKSQFYVQKFRRFKKFSLTAQQPK